MEKRIDEQLIFAKIGKLTVENEMLRGEVLRLRQEIEKLKVNKLTEGK